MNCKYGLYHSAESSIYGHYGPKKQMKNHLSVLAAPLFSSSKHEPVVFAQRHMISAARPQRIVIGEIMWLLNQSCPHRPAKDNLVIMQFESIIYFSILS